MVGSRTGYWAQRAGGGRWVGGQGLFVVGGCRCASGSVPKMTSVASRRQGEAAKEQEEGGGKKTISVFRLRKARLT